MERRTLVSRIAALAAAGGIAAVTVLTAVPAHATGDTEPTLSDTNFSISVKVLGSPVAADQPAGSLVPLSRSSSPGGSGPNAPDAVDTAPPAPKPAATDFMLAGGLYLSELSATSFPTFNPFDGSTLVAFTLRNISPDTIDGSADFWLTSPFGAELGREKVAITSLKPLETRVVTARVHGAGQWPFVTAGMTFTPPDTIAGSEVAPVSRSIFVPVFPWFLLVLLTLAVVGIIVWRVLADAPARPLAEAVT